MNKKNVYITIENNYYINNVTNNNSNNNNTVNNNVGLGTVSASNIVQVNTVQSSFNNINLFQYKATQSGARTEEGVVGGKKQNFTINGTIYDCALWLLEHKVEFVIDISRILLIGLYGHYNTFGDTFKHILLL